MPSEDQQAQTDPRRRVPRTLHDVLNAAVARGGRDALGACGEFGLRAWSGRELGRRVAAVASCLHAAGVVPGERIALWARSSPEWVAAFLALATRGAVALLVERDLPRADARRVAQTAGCRLVLHDDDGGDTHDHDEGLAWRSLARACTPDPGLAHAAPVAVAPTDVAAVLFTSGTTGEPRGVRLTHANLLAPVRPFLRFRWLLRAVPLRLLVLPPATHVLGLVVGVVLPLAIGLVPVYCPSPDVGRWVRAIRHQRIAFAVAVPRMLWQLRTAVLRSPVGRHAPLEPGLERYARWHRAALVFWRRGQLFGRLRFRAFFVGGAALPAESARFWRRAGIAVVQGYGLAETAALVTVGAPFRAGDVGRPLDGVELRLEDDGEVLVRGPGLSPGYVAAGDGGLALTRDGFLATGDLGRLDARGRLVLVGRKKELIVTAEGHNVVPDEVEAALQRQHGVRDAAAVALATAQGEEVHAALLLAPGADAAAAVGAANAELPPFQRVRSWSLWPEADLPRGALGKPRRLEVRRGLAGRLGDASAEAPASDAPPTLAEVLAQPARLQRIEGLAHLLATRPESLRDARLGLGDALGLSSLDVVELVGRVEQQRGALHATPLLAPDATLADLAAALDARALADVAGRDARLPAGEPWWASSLPLRALRPLTRGVTLRVWRTLGADVRSCWHTDASALTPPLVIAAAPHRHWLDAFALFLALPRHLRRRPLVVTDHDFRPWFAPEPGTRAGTRLFSGLGYHAGLPLLFRFAILTSRGRVRDGLLAAARAIDRGYSPLTFPRGLRFGGPEVQAPGAALLALETGRLLLPVHIAAGDGALGLWPRRPRPRVTLHFGAPLEARAGEAREELMARLDQALDALARAAPGCGRE